MAFELAQARARKHLTIIHKSNVLSITDGLFRETVRGVPALTGKYQDVTIAEQLVDSAVYRYVDCFLLETSQLTECRSLFREPE